jgi:hypothetical protein
VAGPGRPQHPRHTPSPTEVLRQSSDDLRPLLEDVLRSEGSQWDKVLVLQARTLEQVHSISRDVGHVHQRLDALETEVRKGHDCTHEEDLAALDEDVGEVKDELTEIGKLNVKVDSRLERLEQRDERSRKWWTSLFGVFGLALVSAIVGGVWWLADHAACDRQDHVQIAETKLVVSGISTQVAEKLSPALQVLTVQVDRHAERLTMLEESDAELNRRFGSPKAKFPRGPQPL